jgi:predicted dehydrogenase
MADFVRVGFVGCGWWATSAHMPAVEARGDAEIVALAEPDAARLAATADRFGVEATFAGAGELLDGAEVDAVVIAVPNSLHYSVARLALERGKHVLLEKPMVLEPADGRALIALAAERRVALVIGYPMHFNPQALALREAISSGRIGAIEHVSCLYTSVVRELYKGKPENYRDLFGYSLHGPAPETYDDRTLAGGGQGQSQLTHALGLLLFLTGLRTERVAAFNSSFELAVDLTDALAVRFEGGATGAISSTGSVLPNHEEIVRYEIFGREGHVVFDVNRGIAEIYDAEGVERLPEITLAERIPNQAPVDNLVELAQGRGTNGSPPEIGLAAVEIVSLMYRSAGSGEVVGVEEVRRP